MSEQNVRAIRDLYDAFNRGDLHTVERGFSRDLYWNEPENSLYSNGNPYRSFAAVREGVFAATARDFDPFRCEAEQFLDAGDSIVVTGRYRGTCRDTGTAIATQFCHVMHLDLDGKVDRLQAYTDTLEEARVTGRAQIKEEMKIPHPAI